MEPVLDNGRKIVLNGGVIPLIIALISVATGLTNALIVEENELTSDLTAVPKKPRGTVMSFDLKNWTAGATALSPVWIGAEIARNSGLIDVETGLNIAWTGAVNDGIDASTIGVKPILGLK